MRQPLLAGLLMASSCWGYQQAAGNLMGTCRRKQRQILLALSVVGQRILGDLYR